MKEKYAIFVKKKIHIEGDERSKQNPGHGYPAHDVQYREVIEFDDVEGLRKWIGDNYDKYDSFSAVKFYPVNFTRQTEIILDGVN
jgi:hypothetical protein